MSGVITAVVATTVMAGTAIYTAEENRKAKSDADEKLKQQKITEGKERDFANKKKANNDVLSSNKALSMRNKAAGTLNEDELGILGVNMQNNMNGSGKLGGI